MARKSNVPLSGAGGVGRHGRDEAFSRAEGLRQAEEELPSQRFSREYAELKRSVKQQGLMDPQPIYYTYKILLTLGMLAASLVVLVVVQNPWVQLLNAGYLGFVFTQIGFTAHDIGHRQTLRASRLNIVGGFLFGNLLLGVSRGWWIDKHNQHHGHPNHIDMDPDIDFPCLAFSEEQALRKRGLGRLMVKHQVYWLLPLFCLTSLSLRSSGILFLREQRAKHRLVEVGLLLVHLLGYAGLIFSQLAFWPALLFIVVNQAVFGLYMALVFAPNHKGMPVIATDEQIDFMRQQILTARNVRPHPITDFLYGGLNYQIEHHLFPGMPRNKLKAARAIVRAACRGQGIAYHETSALQSYQEIIIHMHKVSAPLRAMPYATGD